MLWTVSHTSKEQEDNFLVANREQSSTWKRAGGRLPGQRTPPVSLLTGTIPVHNQITNLTDWAYNDGTHAVPVAGLARREVVRYFVSADRTS